MLKKKLFELPADPASRKRLTVILSTVLACVLLTGVVLVALPGSRVSAATSAGALNSMYGESVIPATYTPVNVPAGTYTMMNASEFSSGKPSTSDDGLAAFDFHIFADTFSSGIHTCGNIAVNRLGWAVLGCEAVPEFGSRQNHDVDTPKLSYVGDLKGWSPAAVSEYFVFGPDVDIIGEKNRPVSVELYDGSAAMMGNDNNGKLLDKIYLENNGQAITSDAQRFINIQQELDEAEGYQRWLVWLMREANQNNYTANYEEIQQTDADGNTTTQRVQYLNYNDVAPSWGWGWGPGGTNIDFGKYDADTIIVDLDSYYSYNFWTGKNELVHNANALINGNVRLTGTAGKRIIFNVNLTRYPDAFKFGNTTMSADKISNSEDSAMLDNNILWNFYTEDSSGVPHSYDGVVTVGGTWVGTVLAPDATIDCNAGLNGSIIASKVTTTCETHKSDYTGERVTSDKTTVTVTKMWQDNPLVRPDFITIQLYRDGKVINSVQMTAPSGDLTSDTWTYTFTDLPSADAKGKSYQYKVAEIVPDGYEMSQMGNTIINKSDAVPEGVVNTYELIVTKTDGKSKLPGAVLVLTSDSGSNLSGATVTGADNYSVTDSSVTWTTGSNEVVIKGLPAGGYTIRESSAPAGYKLAAEKKISLAGNDSVTIVNEPNTVEINKYRYGDEYKDQLPGATFQLSANWGSTLSADMVSGATATLENNVLTWRTGTAPVTLTKIPAGSYTLTETAAPNGYDLAAPVTFVVNTDGTVTINWSPVESVDVYNSLTPVTEREFMLSVTKTGGATANPLAGAQLELTSIAGKNLSEYSITYSGDLSNYSVSGSTISWTSGSAPVVFSGLPEGSYVLREISAPAGYAKANDVSITLNADLTGNKGITMHDASIAVDISKLDSISGAQLTGAQLQLTGKDVNENDIVLSGVTSTNVSLDKSSAAVLKWTSVNAPAALANLPAGTYTLTELAPPPAGYGIAQPVTFTVDVYGNVSGTNVNGTSVSMYDTPVTLDIAKMFWNDTLKATDGGTANVIDNGETGILSGAKLRLTAANGVSLANVTGSITVTHEADGSITWTSGAGANTLRGIPDGTYTLSETAAPAGYDQAKAITFTVTGGKIVTTSGSYTAPNTGDSVVAGAAGSDSAGTVTMCDKKSVFYSVQISKVDAETGAPVPGAVLGIFPEGTVNFSADNALVVYTSTDQPKDLMLYNGNYILKELTAPEGYDINSERISFTINSGDVEINEVIPEVTAGGAFTYGTVPILAWANNGSNYFYADITDHVTANSGWPTKMTFTVPDSERSNIYNIPGEIWYGNNEVANYQGKIIDKNWQGGTYASADSNEFTYNFATEQISYATYSSEDHSADRIYAIFTIATNNAFDSASFDFGNLRPVLHFSNGSTVDLSGAGAQSVAAVAETQAAAEGTSGAFTYGKPNSSFAVEGFYADISALLAEYKTWPNTFTLKFAADTVGEYKFSYRVFDSEGNQLSNIGTNYNISTSGDIFEKLEWLNVSGSYSYDTYKDKPIYLMVVAEQLPEGVTVSDIDLTAYPQVLGFNNNTEFKEITANNSIDLTDGLDKDDIKLDKTGDTVIIKLPNKKTPDEDRYKYGMELTKTDENGTVINSADTYAEFVAYDRNDRPLDLEGTVGAYTYDHTSDYTFAQDSFTDGASTQTVTGLTALPVAINYDLGALVDDLELKVTITNDTKNKSVELPQIAPESITGSWTDLDLSALEFSSGNTLTVTVTETYASGQNAATVGLSFIDPIRTNAGKLSISGMQVGSYYLYETEAPANHKLNEERVDFVITEKNAAPVKVTAVNEALSGALSIVKTDETGRPLSGAQFRVYSVAEDYSDEANPTAVRMYTTTDPITGQISVGTYDYGNGSGTTELLTTGNDGQIKLTGLPLGRIYYAVETAPAPGTENSHSGVKLPALTAATADTEGTGYYVAGKNYGTALGEEIDAYVPTYTWTDTDEDGVVDEDEKASAAFEYVKQTITQYEDVVTVENEAFETRIAKVDKDNKDAALPGAQLMLKPLSDISLKGVSGTVVTSRTTNADSTETVQTGDVIVNAVEQYDENGVLTGVDYSLAWTTGIEPAVIHGLPAGDYVLSETKAPAGYAAAEDVYVRISADGDASYASSPEGLGTATAGDTVVMKDELLTGTITLIKRDKKDNSRIEGVSFTLGVDGEYVTATGANGVYEYSGTAAQQSVFTTGEDGSIVISGLPYDKTYTFTETAPAVGYLAVTEAKSVELTAAQLEKTVNIYNDRASTASITLTKRAADTDALLSGAVFGIEYRKAGSGADFAAYRSETYITDQNGQITVPDLAWGNEYRFVELGAAEGYDRNTAVYTPATVTIDKDDTTAAVTATNRTQTSVTLLKIWDDNNDKYQKRPDKITVQLYANGEPYGDPVEFGEQGSRWFCTWSKLPVVDPEDPTVAMEYSVDEISVMPEGYVKSAPAYDAENGRWVITNSYNPETISVSGVKTWIDTVTGGAARPASITVRLWNGDTEVDNKTVTAADSWAYTFDNLDKNDAAGQPITYTVTEDPVPNYECTISGHSLTNTYVMEKISVTGTKTWADTVTGGSTRPDSITVRLWNGSTEVANKTVTAADNWQYSFDNLDKYADGRLITYTVTEDPVANYECTIDGHNITNTYVDEPFSVSGQKTWVNDDASVRPASITVRLWNGSTEVANKVVTAADNWQYSFDNLDKYADGALINYTITEDAVPGYTETVQGYNVTNTYVPVIPEVPDTVEVSISKKEINGTAELEGARLTLKARTEGVSLDAVVPTIAVEKNADGSISWTSGTAANKLTGLPEGNYILTETTAPNGYAVTEDIIFSVNSEGKVFIGGVEQDGSIVVMRDAPITVSVSKQDINGTGELPGAVLTIIPKDENADLSGVTGTQTVTENEDGSISWTSGTAANLISKLPAGEYTLTETTAPSGYAVTESIGFTIDKNGKVYIGAKEQTDKLLTMKDAVITMSISKQDINGTGELPGALLTLKSLDEKVSLENVTGSQTLTQNEDGTISWTSGTAANLLTGLPTGAYVLSETTAPDGYAVTEDITFTVDENGKVFVNGTEQTGATVVMKDAPITVTVSKKEINGTDELPGAVLTIIPEDEDADLSGVTGSLDVEYDDETGTISWTSGTEANIISKLPAGEYTLTETTAPDGYAKTESIEFTVDEDGKVYIGKTEQTDKVVTMEDAPNEAVISKQAVGGGDELVGAKLTVTLVAPVNENAKLKNVTGTTKVECSTDGMSVTWVSESTANTLSKLPDGIYMLTEETAPAGYKVAEDMYFKVDNGVVYNTTSYAGAATKWDKADKNTVVMFDEQLSVALSFIKYSNLDLRLPGAVFTLTDSTGKSVTATSDTNGVVAFSDLKAGNYTLVETSAPTGYTKSANTVKVEVAADGTVVLRNSAGYQIIASDLETEMENKYIIQGTNPQNGFKPGDKVNLGDDLEKPLDSIKIDWSSSDDTIATVDQNGNVTILKPGTVTITAKHNDDVVKNFVLGANSDSTNSNPTNTNTPNTGHDIVRLSLYVSGALLGAFAAVTAVIYGVRLRKRSRENA